MTSTLRRLIVLGGALVQVGCQSATPGSDQKFSSIDPGETIRFVGTEPFWGGQVQGGTLTYSTPENIEGQRIAVERFAGNHGLGFSGTLNGRPFDMTVTQGECSDGMSDQLFPFTVTLRIGDEVRNGCAHTDSRPVEGPAQP